MTKNSPNFFIKNVGEKIQGIFNKNAMDSLSIRKN